MPIVRSAVCPACDRDLKVCLNCEFYSPGSHWDCRESITDPVAEKDKANFCDWFRFKNSTAPGTGTKQAKGREAKKDFLNLFGDE
jgi:hypothetical protein